MSPWRLILVGLTAAVLVALLGWQAHRERLVRGCLDDGGVWDGPRSLCREPVRPILQRDYQRSGGVRPRARASDTWT